MEWGVDSGLWDRPWTTLSGGEAQRVALAVAVGLDCADILLLDGECYYNTYLIIHRAHFRPKFTLSRADFST